MKWAVVSLLEFCSPYGSRQGGGVLSMEVVRGGGRDTRKLGKFAL